MGHAILDLLKPQLWGVGSHEAAAFHESFGDIKGAISLTDASASRASAQRSCLILEGTFTKARACRALPNNLRPRYARNNLTRSNWTCYEMR